MNNAQIRRIIQTLGENGKIFTVTFIKRSTGEERTMNARLYVTKHLKGGSKSYDDSAKKLLTVYDMQVQGYRCIPLDAVLKINGMSVQEI